MPRIRTIKPEVVSDEKLARMSRDARLTFLLSITQADDYGFLLASPRQLLGSLYPMDDHVTERLMALWLSELVESGLWTQRYTLQGASVIQVTNWMRHQKVDKPAKYSIRDSLAPSSNNPREDSVESSRSDLVPSTYDLVPTTSDQGAATERRGLGFVEPMHEEAYQGYRREHRNPPALDASLKGLSQGMGGPAYDWPTIGTALMDMRAAGSPFTANTLRAFCRKLKETPALSTNGSPSPETFDDRVLARLKAMDAADALLEAPNAH